MRSSCFQTDGPRKDNPAGFHCQSAKHGSPRVIYTPQLACFLILQASPGKRTVYRPNAKASKEAQHQLFERVPYLSRLLKSCCQRKIHPCRRKSYDAQDRGEISYSIFHCNSISNLYDNKRAAAGQRSSYACQGQTDTSTTT